MKVLKFGGTSVGTPESLRSVRAIVSSQPEQCIVVVSALGGITDCLLRTARAALEAADGQCALAADEIATIRRRHAEVIAQMVPADKQQETQAQIDALIDEFITVIRAIGLIGEMTLRSTDLVSSYGERMSCPIVTAMIPGAVTANSLDFIRTRMSYGKNVLDAEKTSTLIKRKFASLADAPVVIVPGFIARNEQERISTLGRGGSDYTAAILAAELGAGVLEIWTDVDGFMSADPRKVKSAQIIERLSFSEAMELCNFGAKVVYPPTIYPVFHKNIPILIKNTFNPTAPGTLIAERRSGKKLTDSDFLGVSAIVEVAMITLNGDKKRDYERLVNTLARNGIETLMPDGVHNLGVRAADLNRAMAAVNEEFAADMISGRFNGVNHTDGLSLTAIVGRGNPASPEAVAELVSALNAEGIPVIYGPMQASPGTLATMVPQACLDSALVILHNTFIIDYCNCVKQHS